MVHVIEKFSMDSWITTLFKKNMINKRTFVAKMTKNVLQRKSKKYIWMVCVWKQKKYTILTHIWFVYTLKYSIFATVLT